MGQPIAPLPPVDAVAYPVAAGPGIGMAVPPSRVVRLPQPVSYIADDQAAEANNKLAEDVAALRAELKKIKEDGAAAKTSAANSPSVVPFGLIQVDGSKFHQDAINRQQFGDVQDAIEFRRARLGLRAAYGVVDAKIEMDFANALNGFNSTFTAFAAYDQQVAFKDVYLTINELPLLGHLRMGHFKEPFSLERLASDKFISFMERSVAEGALVPGRNIGLMAFDWREDLRGTWALGVFRTDMVETPPIFQTDNGGYSATGRLTWLPWYDEASQGRGLLHLGGAFSYREAGTVLDPLANTITFTARPEDRLSPRVVSITFPGDGLNAVDNYELFGGELAFVYGPFSFQAEHMAALVNQRASPANPFFSGGYAEVSCFLTGESRNYNRKLGFFDRVKPCHDFLCAGDHDGCPQTGKGAWEVAYRYSWLNLNDRDDGALGGWVGDHTVGVNWYLNAYTRMMFNWVHSMDVPQNNIGNAALRGIQSNLDIFEWRAQIDF